MTNTNQITNVSPRVQYIADGTNAIFHIPFVIFEKTDVDVYINSVLLEKSSYTVSGTDNNYDILFQEAPKAESVITLARNLPIQRTTHYQERSPISSDSLNSELNYQTACIQEIADRTKRSISLAPYVVEDKNTSLQIPAPSAGKAIVWNKDGTGLENSTVEINSCMEAINSSLKKVSQSEASSKNQAELSEEFAQIAAQKSEDALQSAETAKNYALQARPIGIKNISNCITDLPHDIKLELNNSMLTLKAGSKVYVPNGFEEDGTTPYFDEVITTNDLTLSETQNALREKFVFISQDETQMQTMDVSNTYSGETAPSGSTYMCWYDTKNNLVKTTSNGGSSWTTVSLPIAISHIYSSGFTSIDRVFNGIGYFGSTVYVLPNTKFLIPNGKNEDGSNNNIEYTETEVRLATKTTYESNPDLFFGPFTFYNHTYLGECLTPPAIKNYSVYYNIAENKMYSTGTNGYWSKINNLVYLGRISNYDSRITKAKIRHVFQAVDGNLNRTVVESYQSGSTWYRIWSDGWIEQGGEASGTIANEITATYAKPFTKKPTVIHNQITIWASCGYIYRLSALETTYAKFSNYTSYSTTGNGKTGHIRWYACGY